MIPTAYVYNLTNFNILVVYGSLIFNKIALKMWIIEHDNYRTTNF